MNRTHLLDRPGGYVTDGGMETDLIFHHGVDLPQFAAFPLLDDPDGRRLLRDYYDGYARIAAHAGAGLLLETPTWRANPDWGARVGYDAAALVRVNAAAVAFVRSIADDWNDRVPEIRLVGMVGPRGDGYQAARHDPEQAAVYHQAQVRAFAEAGADLVNAYTLTGPEEAIGVVLAARRAGIAAGVAFTVETDGRLPDGTALAEAIRVVDAACAPAYYGINCAHPAHIAQGLDHAGPWRERIAMVRANASERSHAELDESVELDDGDPARWAVELRALHHLLPGLRVLGGCCGTDARHVAAAWRQW